MRQKVGLPPDEEITVFTKADRDGMTDAVVDRALDVLDTAPSR